MINIIEAAALNAIEHLLPAGHQSLGIHLDVSHVAATPVGFRVTATATVLRVEGRTITFQVQARDDVEVIGSGIHKRVSSALCALTNASSERCVVRDDPAIAAMRAPGVVDQLKTCAVVGMQQPEVPANSLCGREGAPCAA